MADWRETVFENPFLRGLLVTPESGRQYDRQKYEREGQIRDSEAIGLLNKEFTTPELPAAGVLQMRPENLALSDQIYGQQARTPAQFNPTPEYFSRVAQIPSYSKDAIQGMQTAAAAMERQKQEQLYKSGSMTAYESAQHQLGKDRSALEADKFAWDQNPLNPNNIQSLASADASRASAAYSRAQTGEVGKVKPQAGFETIDGKNAPMQGTTPYVKAEEDIVANNTTLKMLTDYKTMAKEGVSGGMGMVGERGRAANALRSNLVTGVAKMIAGEGLATTKADIERAEELVPDLTSAFGSDTNKVTAIDSLVKQAQEKSKSYKDRYGHYRGITQAIRGTDKPPPAPRSGEPPKEK